MFKELVATDIDIDSTAIQKIVFSSIDSYNSLCTNTFHIPYVKDIAPYYPITCEIDFPAGNSKKGIRIAASLAAIKAGASSIDLMIPHALFFLKKYDDFLDDLNCHIVMCKGQGIDLKIVIENRQYDTLTLTTLLSVLKELKIDKIVLSTGMFVDDLYDDILLANEIQEKYLIKAILNRKICTRQDMELISDSGIYGIKTKSILKY